MKKLLIIGMILALMFTGCAAIKSAFTSAPVNFICSPTAEQKATAAAMLAALDAAQAAGAIFFPVIGIAKASAVLNVIVGGGCFLLAELAEAFKAVDAANVAVAQAQLKMLKGAPPVMPEYTPLRRLVK